jgi:cysteine sulfinate desulfinase/cysteine desulfurase-like protein
MLAELIVNDPKAHQLAEELLNILERVFRTSCATETVNSIIKPYLWGQAQLPKSQVRSELALSLYPEIQYASLPAQR